MEPKFAAAGCAVITNSSAFRMQPSVPLVIPEVNADHLALVENQSVAQRERRVHRDQTRTVRAIGLVLALKPLVERFGMEAIFVSTMQAVSGAGYPGVASLDILGNVVPYIKNEEEKMEAETLKLLGRLNGRVVEPLGAKMTAHCNRVAVEDGHTESVSVKLGRKTTREEMIAAWAEFAPLNGKNLPRRRNSRWSLSRPTIARSRAWTGCGHGMAATVGRLRPCGLLDWKFTVLSHNTIRGAAGAALLNAEILASLGKLDPVESGGMKLALRGDEVRRHFGGGHSAILAPPGLWPGAVAQGTVACRGRQRDGQGHRPVIGRSGHRGQRRPGKRAGDQERRESGTRTQRHSAAGTSCKI